jgi:hypothetical protein|tara:strand:+ start:49 stop:843 length:795 start_codon:yes stop_codon:yes gene_type:complete
MPEIQFNLFSGSGVSPDNRTLLDTRAPCITPSDLDDDTLLDAIMEARLSDKLSLIAEVERRGIATAVPVLEKLCFRFAGFGTDHLIPEQETALRALAAIGGHEAASSVSRLIFRAAVQGPTLKVAVDVAARLKSNLPGDIVHQLLGHADPEVRANACRFAQPTPDINSILIDLLDDLDERVNAAAACALGRMGYREARPILSRMLRDAPSEEIVEAISGVADEDCIILLGRIFQREPNLSGAVRDALDAIDHPRAAQVIGNVGA